MKEKRDFLSFRLIQLRPGDKMPIATTGETARKYALVGAVFPSARVWITEDDGVHSVASLAVLSGLT